ncbi:hypothetical protein AAHE18_14G126700 [Arachis hypogaea]
MCRLPEQGTTMGECEPRDIHLHAMFRDTPRSWSAYIQGAIYNLGYMVARSGFFHAMYVEKKWASKEGLISGATNYFPKNISRKLSLEESILSKHVAQVLPPLTRAHGGGSLVVQKKSSAPPLIKRASSSVDFDKFIGKSNGSADLFALLSVQEDKQGFSSWATFD